MDNKTHTQKTREQTIYAVTWLAFFTNLLLTLAKLFAGIVGKSGAMVADAVHSASDFVTDIVVLLFVKIASKPYDEDHDYGHGKYETLATIIIGSALLAVSIGILLNSIKTIRVFFQGAVIDKPGLLALLAAFASILIKETLFRYTLHCGKKVQSPALIANSWHQRSDAMSSVGTLIGIGCAYFLGEKWRILDPLAAIFVSALIGKVAFELIVPSVNELLEKSLPKETENEIIAIITQFPEICNPHKMKTRSIGLVNAIEFHVRVDGKMSVTHAHEITKKLEHKIFEKFGEKTQIIIHIEPKIDKPKN